MGITLLTKLTEFVICRAYRILFSNNVIDHSEDLSLIIEIDNFVFHFIQGAALSGQEYPLTTFRCRGLTPSYPNKNEDTFLLYLYLLFWLQTRPISVVYPHDRIWHLNNVENVDMP